MRTLSSLLSFAAVVAGLAMPATTAEPTFRVSLGYQGGQSNERSLQPVSSPSGRFIGFTSAATNLILSDTNAVWDGFVRDQVTGKLFRATIGTHGEQPNGIGIIEAISRNDRFVSFYSEANNLVAEDTNRVGDVFLRDLLLDTTERVSLGSGGEQADNFSGYSCVSADGRFVAFMSAATNLHSGDTNGWEDVFVRDRWLGTTMRVSVSSTGEQGNNYSTIPSMSNDGRHICYVSRARNLVEGDTNQSQDVFVHDLQTGVTERISVSSDEAQGNSDSGGGYPNRITPDGRFVVFSSTASNLVSGDSNRTVDVFVRDRWLGTTTRVSVRSDGGQGNRGGGTGNITDDGHYVAFASASTNLTDDGDVNDRLGDIFMHDMWTGETWRISNNTNGEQGNAQSEACVMSANGKIVAFASNATNLAPNDTNGFMDIFVHINARIGR